MPRVVPTALTQSFGPSLHAVLARCPLYSVFHSTQGFLPRFIADAEPACDDMRRCTAPSRCNCAA
eukprot:3562498-Heterocapsa_arctica.AAC.1